MALYTKTGDEGETGLFGNRRVSKDDLRIEAYGVIDELNSCLGVLRSETLDPQTEARIQQMQNLLFECGADLATDGAAEAETPFHDWRLGPKKGTAGGSIKVDSELFGPAVTKVQSGAEPVRD